MDMKKPFSFKIATILLAIVFIVGCTLPSKAHATPSETKITGVAGTAGHPVKGITPWATCQGYKQHATSPTDTNGHYLIIFAANNCPIRSTAKVHIYETIAGGGTYVGSTQVVITGEVTHLDIVAYEPVGIPEYSWITGSVALATATAMCIVIRKKHLA